jgi:hypothetical protein
VGSVLGWPPVVWAMRVALLVLLAGCSYLYLLLIAPFFRPAHVVRMLKADIPRVRKFGAEIAGTRGEVEFERTEDSVRRALRVKVRTTRKAKAGSGEGGRDEPDANVR